MAVTETIQEILQGIDDAQYGRDMRQFIHKGIQKCYEEGSAGETDLVARESVEKILEIFGDVESGDTASKAYAVGESVIYDGRLYKVISAIAQGDTFTEGTNIEESRATSNVGDLYELPYNRLTNMYVTGDETKLYIIPSIKLMIVDVSILCSWTDTSGKMGINIGSKLPVFVNNGDMAMLKRCASATLYEAIGDDNSGIIKLTVSKNNENAGSSLMLLVPPAPSSSINHFYGQLIVRYTKLHADYPLSSATLVADS